MNTLFSNIHSTAPNKFHCCSHFMLYLCQSVPPLVSLVSSFEFGLQCPLSSYFGTSLTYRKMWVAKKGRTNGPAAWRKCCRDYRSFAAQLCRGLEFVVFSHLAFLISEQSHLRSGLTCRYWSCIHLCSLFLLITFRKVNFLLTKLQ